MPVAVAAFVLAILPSTPIAAADPESPPRIERCSLSVAARPDDVDLRLECTLRLFGAEEIPLRWLAFEGSQLDRSGLVTRLDGRPVRTEWRPLERASGRLPDERTAALLVLDAGQVARRESVRLEVRGTLRGAIEQRGERAVITVPVPAPPWPTDGAADAFEVELHLPSALEVIDAFPAGLAATSSDGPPRARLPALPSLVRFTTISTLSAAASTTFTRTRVIDLVLALTLVAIGIGAWLLVGRSRSGS